MGAEGAPISLGFAAAPDAEGDWGDDSEEEPRPEAEPAKEEVVEKEAVEPARPALEPPAAGPPRSKIHCNPRTRYFVIKSINHKNLVLSIENNVWATQRHNEDVLNEALHNAPHVILIFSVNCSGCFQGYAKMLSPVGTSNKTHVFPGYGRAFDVRWLRLDDLDFAEVANLQNPWNENKSVKISRDGQELPNDVGRRLCELVDNRVYRGDPAGYVTDENEVETGGFAPPLPLEPPGFGATPPGPPPAQCGYAGPYGGAPPPPGCPGPAAPPAWDLWRFPPWSYPWPLSRTCSSSSYYYSSSESSDAGGPVQAKKKRHKGSSRKQQQQQHKAKRSKKASRSRRRHKSSRRPRSCRHRQRRPERQPPPASGPYPMRPPPWAMPPPPFYPPPPRAPPPAWHGPPAGVMQ